MLLTYKGFSENPDTSRFSEVPIIFYAYRVFYQSKKMENYISYYYNAVTETWNARVRCAVLCCEWRLEL